MAPLHRPTSRAGMFGALLALAFLPLVAFPALLTPMGLSGIGVVFLLTGVQFVGSLYLTTSRAPRMTTGKDFREFRAATALMGWPALLICLLAWGMIQPGSRRAGFAVGVAACVAGTAALAWLAAGQLAEGAAREAAAQRRGGRGRPRQ